MPTLRSRIPESASDQTVETIRRKVEQASARAQYGWGHTIDFGPFTKMGLLLDSYLNIAGLYDQLGWWPLSLSGLRAADVGCYTGGIAVLMAERGAAAVFAVDELESHVEQCQILVDTFELAAIRPMLSTLYELENQIASHSLDLIVCAGVLYHLSDMLVGLEVMRRLLKPGGTLLLEGNGVDDPGHSYANFGRFFGGMWWQPTGTCTIDMCTLMGYDSTTVHFYEQNRYVARAVATSRGPEFKRGVNAKFESLRDERLRSLDPSVMAPARLR